MTAEESRTRLENTFPLNIFQGETQRQLVEFVLEEIAETEKAYGGCHSCYGKGYATVNDKWLAFDTDQDIGSPGGTFSGGEDFAMKFCSCDRGKQLETQMDYCHLHHSNINHRSSRGIGE